MNKYDLEEFRKRVKKHLDKDRYQHTLGVMYTAASMAMCHDVDVEEAMVAGLLHDCAKCLPTDEKYKLCQKYHLTISKAEKENPALLHAKLGAAIAAKKYEIEDRKILNAIMYHTTGRPNMTMLEKIIYIADYIEPGRNEAPNLRLKRRLAFEDMDACLYAILEDTLSYLNQCAGTIDPMTEETYHYYKEHKN